MQYKLDLRRFGALAFACLSAVTAACAEPPADPEGTLDRVRGGTLRAGITENNPWVTLQGDEPGGVEVRLLEELVEELDSEIEWTIGSEQELFGALELGQLDVVIGGLISENPYSQHAAFTHPYVTTQVIIGAPQGFPVADIAGMEVAVEAGTEAAGVLEKTDAIPILVDGIAAADGAAAVDDWLLDDLELEDTGVRLIESDHVMAVRLGENGWMVTLELFLLERADEIDRLIEEEGAL